MLKTEVICGSCNTQFVVVSIESESPEYCPFCATPILDEVDLSIGEDE